MRHRIDSLPCFLVVFVALTSIDLAGAQTTYDYSIEITATRDGKARSQPRAGHATLYLGLSGGRWYAPTGDFIVNIERGTFFDIDHRSKTYVALQLPVRVDALLDPSEKDQVEQARSMFNIEAAGTKPMSHSWSETPPKGFTAKEMEHLSRQTFSTSVDGRDLGDETEYLHLPLPAAEGEAYRLLVESEYCQVPTACHWAEHMPVALPVFQRTVSRSSGGYGSVSERRLLGRREGNPEGLSLEPPEDYREVPYKLNRHMQVM